jgi:hypothetical protein
MDVSDIGMIMRDCTPKPAKPSKLNEQQRADWLRMSAEPIPMQPVGAMPRDAYCADWPAIDPDMIPPAPEAVSVPPTDSEAFDVMNRARGGLAGGKPYVEFGGRLYVAEDEAKPVISISGGGWVDWSNARAVGAIEQAPRRRAAWLPEGE